MFVKWVFVSKYMKSNDIGPDIYFWHLICVMNCWVYTYLSPTPTPPHQPLPTPIPVIIIIYLVLNNYRLIILVLWMRMWKKYHYIQSINILVFFVNWYNTLKELWCWKCITTSSISIYQEFVIMRVLIVFVFLPIGMLGFFSVGFVCVNDKVLIYQYYS